MGPPSPRLVAAGLSSALVLVLLLVAGCTGGGSPPTSDTGGGEPGAATIVEVVDGDTVDVEVGGASETVRLLGIDTPETVDPDEPVGCYGPEASERTKALLPPGTEIRLERDEEARDRYGRLLAYVHRADDGLFVNEALLREGFATTLLIEPNHAYASQMLAAQDDAQTAGAGLWSACPTVDGG
jgi:micrococcal nuclease